MDTKLKRFLRSNVTKIFATAICVICITVSMLQIAYLDSGNKNLECVFVEDYQNSNQFKSYVNRVVHLIVYSPAQLNESPWNDLIHNQNIMYYYENGDDKYQNTDYAEREFYEKFDYYVLFENGKWTVSKNTPEHVMNYMLDRTEKVYVAFHNDLIEQAQQKWQSDRHIMINSLLIICITGIIAILLLIYLIVVAGKRSQDNEIHLIKVDSIYSEILIAAGLVISVLWASIIRELSWNYSYYNNYLDYFNTYTRDFYGLLIGVVTAIALALMSIVLFSLIRKTKAGIIFKHSFIYRIVTWIYRIVRACFKGLFDASMFYQFALTKSLFYRQTVFILLSTLNVIIVLFSILMEMLLLFLLPVILEIVFIVWYIKGNIILYHKINDGIQDSFDEQMKAERMKVALITNVSHDLKTPLTSIISYVDLLSKEELSDTSLDYVRILQDKSERLKHIVMDLFDLAKSTSGNIALEMEQIDLKRLIEQTLADMSDKIQESSLQIKTNLPLNSIMIYSDGKKLYRVFQNVIDNALKYSMSGTRVFVELKETEHGAVADIKNIAGYEMDFTAEEVLQRFNRGDKSRSTEGSGLGLSIAESFTRVSGGDFKVSIDGDLFKVTLSFPIVKQKII